MQIKQFWPLLAVAIGLAACNSGGGSSTTTTNTDVQDFLLSIGGSGPNNFDFSGTATSCVTTTTCSVALTYSGTGAYAGALGLTPSGYTSTIGNCPAATTESQTCNFTITGYNLTQTKTIYITANGSQTAHFKIGG